MIKNIFFDLDNTLYEANQELFWKFYFSGMVKMLSESGLDGKALASWVFSKGVEAMKKNDGSKFNSDVYWDAFEMDFNIKREEIAPALADMYGNRLEELMEIINQRPEMVEAVLELKRKGYRLFLTTNPMSPCAFTERRLAVAGYKKEWFEHITYMENCCEPSKSDVKYYKNIMDKFKINPEEILMVGNNEKEDGIVESLGIKCFLINNGNVKQFLKLAKNMPKIKK